MGNSRLHLIHVHPFNYFPCSTMALALIGFRVRALSSSLFNKLMTGCGLAKEGERKRKRERGH